MRPGDLDVIGPVQVVASGLTGFLQLKQGGVTPGWLDQTIQPSVDLRDWWFASRRVDELTLNIATSTSAITTVGIHSFNVGGVGNATVPQNNLWWIDWWEVACTTALAADIVNWSVVLANNSFTSTMTLTNPVQIGGGARVVTGHSQACTSRGIWAQPGDNLCFFVNDISSAGITFAQRVRATVLQI